jgi:ABC-type multidrug transport system ATPase subunit
MNILTVDNLSIGHNSPLKKDISFTLNKGEMLILKGENGSGKTTLLKTLLKEVKPLDGSFSWNIRAGEISLLPQIVNSGPHFNYTINEILDAFSINEDIINIRKDILPRKWSYASGGEKQKAMILSRLSKDKKILILDEPFNHLDKESIIELEAFLIEILENRIIEGLIIISHVPLKELEIRAKVFNLS